MGTVRHLGFQSKNAHFLGSSVMDGIPAQVNGGAMWRPAPLSHSCSLRAPLRCLSAKWIPLVQVCKKTAQVNFLGLLLGFPGGSSGKEPTC